MKFSYKKLATGHVRPIIQVEVSHNGGQAINYFALIDSGADICIFHAEIAELIGIEDITTGRKGTVGGITQGEQQDYWIHPVSINVGGWKYDLEVAFMPTLSRLGYGVFGQKGFFDSFAIKFRKVKGEIELVDETQKTKE
ncbi:MAG: hypothetical protein PHS53_00350 [Candidatus Pacebacteria bacterium]|nr:hypothetical protein [Candidatus Paceibacterota bacterium]